MNYLRRLRRIPMMLPSGKGARHCSSEVSRWIENSTQLQTSAKLRVWRLEYGTVSSETRPRIPMPWRPRPPSHTGSDCRSSTRSRGDCAYRIPHRHLNCSTCVFQLLAFSRHVRPYIAMPDLILMMFRVPFIKDVLNGLGIAVMQAEINGFVISRASTNAPHRATNVAGLTLVRSAYAELFTAAGLRLEREIETGVGVSILDSSPA